MLAIRQDHSYKLESRLVIILLIGRTLVRTDVDMYLVNHDDLITGLSLLGVSGRLLLKARELILDFLVTTRHEECDD